MVSNDTKRIFSKKLCNIQNLNSKYILYLKDIYLLSRTLNIIFNNNNFHAIVGTSNIHPQYSKYPLPKLKIIGKNLKILTQYEVF